jgi:hypothetical protein
MEPSGPTYGERVGQGGPLVWPPSCRRKFACRDAGDATSLAVASDGRSRCFAEVRDDGVGSPDVAELGPSHLATKRSAAGKPTVREAQADPKPPVGLPQSCPRPSLAFSRFASTKQPLVIYGSRPTAAGRQPDEILSAAVVSTNKKPRCLSGAFVRRCPLPLPRSCQTSETERGEGARIGGAHQIRANHRDSASSDGRPLADRVPSHPHPSERHWNRRRGAIRLSSRSKKRRGMRSR